MFQLQILNNWEKNTLTKANFEQLRKNTLTKLSDSFMWQGVGY